jgi:hypothetical protein
MRIDLLYKVTVTVKMGAYYDKNVFIFFIYSIYSNAELNRRGPITESERTQRNKPKHKDRI